jgi:hypothetical protein
VVEDGGIGRGGVGRDNGGSVMRRFRRCVGKSVILYNSSAASCSLKFCGMGCLRGCFIDFYPIFLLFSYTTSLYPFSFRSLGQRRSSFSYDVHFVLLILLQSDSSAQFVHMKRARGMI